MTVKLPCYDNGQIDLEKKNLFIRKIDNLNKGQYTFKVKITDLTSL